MHTNTDDGERNEIPNETSDILTLTIIMLIAKDALLLKIICSIVGIS